MAEEYAGAKEMREPVIPTIYISATTPANAAFTTVPPVGTLVYCTGDSKLYIKHATTDTWKSVTLA